MTSSAPPRAARSRASLALASFALIALLLAAGIAWVALRRAAPVPAPVPAREAQQPAEPARAALELHVVTTAGTVERSGSEGGWRPVSAGDTLHADEQLRTAPGARAELSVDGRSRVTIAERTQLTLRELTSAMHRFRLTRGLVAVDYQRDGARVLRIEEVGGAAAEARGARFQVAANGLAFAVATETGGVTLSAGGAAVELGAGEQAHSSGGAPPQAPRPISTAVLLKVAAAHHLGSGRCADTSGRTEPGALVTVDGRAVEVGSDGRFTIHADRAGPEGALVSVVVPGAREVTRRIPCSSDQARIRELRMRWTRGDP